MGWWRATLGELVIDPRIVEQLKEGPEQQLVVGPLVQRLLDRGWSLDQMIFGRREYVVPKTPSESNKREKGWRYEGFPVDIAVFETPALRGDYRGLIFLVECKQPDEAAGLEQLDILFGREPHPRLGIWANSATTSSPAVFLYRDERGRRIPENASLPIRLAWIPKLTRTTKLGREMTS
jgi:type I restriction enzyme M protein